MDEHIWRPSRVGDKDRAVTGMVDLTRDAHGQLHARLLDVVPGPDRHRLRRLAQAPAEHLHRRDQARLPRPVPRLRQRDPRRAARRGRGPRRVPRRQARHPGRRRGPPPGPAGHPGPARPQGRPAVQDPRPATPRTRTPVRQADRQAQHLPQAGDPGWEVTLAWHAYQQLRSMYQADDPGRGQADRRAGHRLVPTSARSPRSPASAAPSRCGASTSWPGSTPTASPTAAPRPSTCIIEKTRRLAHGFRTFEHYRLRILLAASGTRPYRRAAPMLNSEEPGKRRQRRQGGEGALHASLTFHPALTLIAAGRQGPENAS